MNKKHLLALFASFSACGSLPASCDQTEISVLTYNVYGLPESITGSNAAENILLISPLLNSYDIALIQEDFFYHSELSSAAEYPYQIPAEGDLYNEKGELVANPSGLTNYSEFPLKNYVNRRWFFCNGIVDQKNDCLAPKGFSAAEHEITPNVLVDVYNCHMDAGDSPGDVAARYGQIEQLAKFLDTRSPRRAVIVACDTNMNEQDRPQLEQLLLTTGLKDSCQELNCPEPDRIDRIFYRNGAAVRLEPLRWYIPKEFEGKSGEGLSDHEPVAVDFKVTVGPFFY